MTLPQAAIAFTGRHPAVVSTVLGAADPDQVLANAERGVPVPARLWDELDTAGLVPAEPAASHP